MNQRTYSMTVRDARATATRERILAACAGRYGEPSSDFTLEQVADAAGVSVRTVLRLFGSKDGLIIEAVQHRPFTQLAQTPPSVRDAVRQLFDDFEANGDRAVRIVADEYRVPGMAALARATRRSHQAWLEVAFAPQLAAVTVRQRAQLLVLLSVATDSLMWKMLRRDLGLSRKAAELAVENLIHGVVATSPAPPVK